MTPSTALSPQRSISKPSVARYQRSRDLAYLPFGHCKAGNSPEARLYRRTVRELRQHLGRPTSRAENMIIGRLAWLQVHLSRIDERALAEGGLSDHARREYLAWSGAFCRLLRELGLQPRTAAEEKPPSLAEILAEQDHRTALSGPTDAAHSGRDPPRHPGSFW